jgi:hypothetical protein
MGKIIKTDVERITLIRDHRASVLVVVVLVAGAVDDYAAYRGAIITDTYTEMHDRWVADHGDKLSFSAAQHHFPFIVDERYRR